MKLTKILLLLLCALSFVTVSAQNAKKFEKEGEKFYEEGNYLEAINSLNEAIKLKPDDEDAYIFRAQAYEKINKLDDAVADYQAAIKLDPKNKKLFYALSDVYFQQKKYDDVLKTCNDILVFDNDNVDALQRICYTKITTKDFNGALSSINIAVAESKTNYISVYYQALALDSLGDLTNALVSYGKCVDLLKVLKENEYIIQPRFQCVYTDMAYAQYRRKMYVEALTNYATALKIDTPDLLLPKTDEIYRLRALVHFAKLDIQNALNDLTSAIATNDKNIKAFYDRGMVYKKAGQHLNAINDFTKVTVLDNNNYLAFAGLGACHTELGKFPEAIKEFKMAVSLNPNDRDVKLQFEDAKKKEYEANRETNPPSISLSYPVVDNKGFLNIENNKQESYLEGTINDVSKIKVINIDGKEIEFDKEAINPTFKHKISLFDKNRIMVLAMDIYNNEVSNTFKIARIIPETKNKVLFAGRVESGDGDHSPYSNFLVYLYNAKGEKISQIKTDNSGYFSFENLPFDQNYLIRLDEKETTLFNHKKLVIINKEGKESLIAMNGEGNVFEFTLLQSDPHVMELMSIEDSELKVDLEGRLLTGDGKQKPMPFQTVNVCDATGKVLYRGKTDANGNFKFSKLPPDDHYMLMLDSVDTEYGNLSSIIIADNKGKVIREINRDRFGKFNYQLLPEEISTLTSLSEHDMWETALTLSPKKKELTIIESIFYEVGQYTIPKDGEEVLNKAINLLATNKNVSLEIVSHTDSQSSDEFNLDLSQKRAKAAVDFMLAKGADVKRLKGTGMGEAELLNHCKNDVDCSDTEHKQNRRTAFKITYHEEAKK